MQEIWDFLLRDFNFHVDRFMTKARSQWLKKKQYFS